MRLFKKGSATADEVATAPAVFALPPGTLPCNERGCGLQTGIACAYVDRRRRGCDTAWCPDHVSVVHGRPYCRRHAGTVRAMGSAADDPLAMPDVDNRAPSLTNWVAKDLDAFIEQQLLAVARPHEQFVREGDVKIIFDRLRNRRFERSWKLIDHTGLVIQVTLYVTESDDATVCLKVGAHLIAQGVPPWIERRRRGQQVSAEVDAAERRLFYEFLQGHITQGLQRARSMDDRYS